MPLGRAETDKKKNDVSSKKCCFSAQRLTSKPALKQLIWSLLFSFGFYISRAVGVHILFHYEA